jgi:hypothetical protein
MEIVFPSITLLSRSLTIEELISKTVRTDVLGKLGLNNRSLGLGWRAIAQQLGVGVGTLYRVASECSKTQQKLFWNAIREPRPGGFGVVSG